MQIILLTGIGEAVFDPEYVVRFKNSSNFSFASFSAARALSNSSLSLTASAARFSDSSTSLAVKSSASRVFLSRETCK